MNLTPQQPQRALPAPSFQHEAASFQIAFTDLLRVPLRRWRLLLVAFLLALLAAVLLLPMFTASYSSEAVLVVERSSSDIATFETPLTGLVVDSQVIASEIELIYSRGLVERVIASLDLLETEEFGAGDDSERDTGIGASAMNEQPLQQAVSRFRSQLSVQRKGISRAIVIKFESVDARRAANVVNEIATQYVEQQLAWRSEQEAEATRRIRAEIDALRDRLVKTELEIEDHRQRIGQSSGSDVSKNQSVIASLTAERAIASSAHSDAVALYQQAALLADNPVAFAALPSSDISPGLQPLRSSELAAQARLDELSLTYGSKHPSVQRARNELARVRASIRNDIDRSLEVLEGRIELARSREVTLKQEIERLEREETDTWPLRAELLALERERKSDAERLAFYSARLREVSQAISVDNLKPFARVISAGVVAVQPDFPAPFLLPLIVPVLGILACAIWLIFARLLNRPLPETLPYGASWLSSLPRVPRMYRLPLFGRGLASYRPYRESLRSVRAGLTMATGGQLPIVVLVSGLGKGDGVTSLAVSLARESAARGDRTTLIDLDMRDPSVHRVLGIRPEYGVADVLSGQCTVERACVSRIGGMLQVLAAGRPGMDIAAELAQPALGELVERCARDSKLVVIDSPAVLEYPDSGICARLSTLSVLVVTPASLGEASDTLHRAVDRLRVVADDAVAVVLNRADPAAESRALLEYAGSDSYFNRMVKPLREHVLPQESVGDRLHSGGPRIHDESWLLRQSPESYTIKMLVADARPDPVRASSSSSYANEPLACYSRTNSSGGCSYIMLRGIYPSIDAASAAYRQLGDYPFAEYVEILRLSTIQQEIVEQRYRMPHAAAPVAVEVP